MSTTRAGREFGEGLLSRVAALVYNLIVVEALFLLTTAPGLVLLVLLDRDASNAPLAAVAMIPLGPALSAAVYAMRHRGTDLTDLAPAKVFWRGYRANAAGVLKLWIPWLAWLGIIAVNLGHFSAAGLPGWWRVLLVVVSLLATLWVADALVITSLFAFRAVDVARLALHFLVRRPGATLGNAGLLAAAAGVTVLTSELVLALLGSLLAAALLWNCRTVLADVRDQFTA